MRKKCKIVFINTSLNYILQLYTGQPHKVVEIVACSSIVYRKPDWDYIHCIWAAKMCENRWTLNRRAFSHINAQCRVYYAYNENTRRYQRLPIIFEYNVFKTKRFRNIPFPNIDNITKYFLTTELYYYQSLSVANLPKFLLWEMAGKCRVFFSVL